MITPDDLLRFAIVPIVVAMIVIALTWRKAWGRSLALGTAIIAAAICIFGPEKVCTLSDATAWLAYAAAAFTFLGWIASFLRWLNWHALIALGLVTAATAGLMLKFNFTSGTWSLFSGTIALATIAVLAVVCAASVQWRSEDHSILAPLAMSMIAGLGGLSVMTLADQSVGEAIAAMGIALLPIIAAAVIQRSSPISESTTPIIFGGMLAAALACSAYASEVPIIDALAIVSAAPLFAVTGLIPRWRFRAWQLAGLRLIITAIPLVMVMTVAIRAMQKANAEGGDAYSAANVPAHVAAETSATS